MINLRRCTALLLLTCVGFACSGVGPVPKNGDETPTVSCPANGCCHVGLPKTTSTECGCEPYAQALESRMLATHVADHMRAKVAQCVNGSLDAKVYKWEIASAKADGCVRTEVELEPQVRDTLLKVVEEYKVSGEMAKDVWKGCYERTTAAAEPVATPGPAAAASTGQ